MSHIVDYPSSVPLVDEASSLPSLAYHLCDDVVDFIYSIKDNVCVMDVGDMDVCDMQDVVCKT